MAKEQVEEPEVESEDVETEDTEMEDYESSVKDGYDKLESGKTGTDEEKDVETPAAVEKEVQEPSEPSEPSAPTQEQAYEQREAALQQQVAEVNQRIQQYNQIVQNPQFQQAYQQYIQQQQQPQGQQQQETAAEKADRLSQITPETPTEQALVDVLTELRQQMDERNQQLEQRFGSVDSRVGRFENFMQRRSEEQMNAEIDEICRGESGLQSRFPDLFDSGAKEEELYEKAAHLINGEAQRGAFLSTRDALEQAAKVLSFDTIEQRAKSALAQEAEKARRAQVDTPDAASGGSSTSWEDQARAAYERAGLP